MPNTPCDSTIHAPSGDDRGDVSCELDLHHLELHRHGGEAGLPPIFWENQLFVRTGPELLSELQFIVRLPDPIERDGYRFDIFDNVDGPLSDEELARVNLLLRLTDATRARLEARARRIALSLWGTGALFSDEELRARLEAQRALDVERYGRRRGRRRRRPLVARRRTPAKKGAATKSRKKT